LLVSKKNKEFKENSSGNKDSKFYANRLKKLKRLDFRKNKEFKNWNKNVLRELKMSMEQLR